MRVTQTRVTPLKTKLCTVCNTPFTYAKSNTIYCSNACKCKSYQDRLKGQNLPPSKNKTQKNYLTMPPEEVVKNNNVQELEQYISFLHHQMNIYLVEFQTLFNDLIKQNKESADSYEKTISKLRAIIDNLIEEKKEASQINAIAEIAAKLIK